MEAEWVTGPAKNVLQFARLAAEPTAELPPVHLSLAVFRRGSRKLPLLEAASAAGVPVHIIAERYRYDLSVMRQLQNLVEREQPDIVQTHNVKSHALVRWLGLWRRQPWIAFNHGYTAVDWKDRLYNHLDRWSLTKAQRVVTVCRPFMMKLRQSGVSENHIVIRHNSIAPFKAPPPEMIARTREAFGLSLNAAVILSVGRLSREKGHACLLEAVALLNRHGAPSFRLLIIGDGPEKASLRERCRALGLDSTVVFAGHRTDVDVFYSMADILALPSHSEGSPNVVLEAMAAGVPVVATAVGGVPEIVEHARTGLLVPAGRPDAMAKAMASLLTDEKLRRSLAAAARCCIDEKFSPQAYRRSLVGVYQDMLAASH